MPQCVWPWSFGVAPFDGFELETARLLNRLDLVDRYARRWDGGDSSSASGEPIVSSAWLLDSEELVVWVLTI